MATKKQPAKKVRNAKTAKSKPRADRCVLGGTYIGEKQFRQGEEVWLGCVGKGAVRVECVGPSLRKPGMTTVQWVKAEDLADLRLEWSATGRKRADVEAELFALLQAADTARKAKTSGKS